MQIFRDKSSVEKYILKWLNPRSIDLSICDIRKSRGFVYLSAICLEPQFLQLISYSPQTNKIEHPCTQTLKIGIRLIEA